MFTYATLRRYNVILATFQLFYFADNEIYAITSKSNSLADFRSWHPLLPIRKHLL